MNKSEKIELIVHKTTLDYQVLDINILGDGLIEPTDLLNIVLPEELENDKGVIISGKCPIWLYSYLTHLLHSFAWVATLDPRLGGIVTQNHIANGKKIGEIIPIDELKPLLKQTTSLKKNSVKTSQTNENLIVVVGGPPHSGKSVFVQALRNELRKKTPSKFNEDVFIIRACPDGEGDWFGDIFDNERIIYLKKCSFTDEFAQKTAEDIENVSKTKKIVIVDVGGKLDKKNNLIFSKTNFGIIVSSNIVETNRWEGAYQLCNINLLATIFSDLNGETKVEQENPLIITLSKLDRNKVREVKIPEILINKFLEYL